VLAHLSSLSLLTCFSFTYLVFIIDISLMHAFKEKSTLKLISLLILAIDTPPYLHFDVLACSTSCLLLLPLLLLHSITKRGVPHKGEKNLCYLLLRHVHVGKKTRTITIKFHYSNDSINVLIKHIIFQHF
jgi:hypothetical protein